MAVSLTLSVPATTARSSPNGVWSELGPPTRHSHATVYDPVRDRMLVIGGTNGSARNEVWEMTLSPDASWHPITVTGPALPPREAPSAVYDPVRDRVVVFGGADANGVKDDVWALSLDSSPAWTQLTPSGTPPQARYRHAAIYDPVRDRVIVFAGDAATMFNPYRNDVWALSLDGAPAWTHLLPSGTLPAVRAGANAIYDALNDRLVAFAGQDDFNGYRDTWALSLGASPAWTKLLPTGALPDGRAGAGAIYDPVRQRMVISGGTGTYNDVWALDLGVSPAWTQLTPSGDPPTARAWTTAIYDPLRDRMLMYGGTGYGFKDDTWALSLDGSPAWTPVVLGVHPPGRSNHTAVLDTQRNRMIVYGGSPVYTQPWALDLGTVPNWTELTTVGAPSGLSDHVAIYDPVGDRMIVFGGSGSDTSWQLSLADPPTWTRIEVTGPSPRNRSAAAYDPIGHRMIVFGGDFNGTNYGDTWALSLDGPPAWTPIAGTHPSARNSAQMVFDAANSRMLLIGGGNGLLGGELNDCWALSLGATPAWSEVSAGGTMPVARELHGLAYDDLRSRVLMVDGFGVVGHDGSTTVYGAIDDAQGLEVSGSPTWAALTPDGLSPGGRQAHTTIYDPDLDRVILYGGNGVNGAADTWILSFRDTPAPEPASLLSASRQPGEIEVAWQGREVYRPGGLLYRRENGGQWTPLASLTPDVSNQLHYVDPLVSDASVYDYLVSFSATSGAQYSEPAHLSVTTGVGPFDGNLAIQSARFGDEGLEVAFSLATDAPARLDLFDVVGRRVGSSDLAGLEVGGHTVRLGGGRIVSGLYWLRLSQGRETRVVKATRIR